MKPQVALGPATLQGRRGNFNKKTMKLFVQETLLGGCKVPLQGLKLMVGVEVDGCQNSQALVICLGCSPERWVPRLP